MKLQEKPNELWHISAIPVEVANMELAQTKRILSMKTVNNF